MAIDYKSLLNAKGIHKLLIPYDILRTEDAKCLQYIGKQPLNRNKITI